MAYYPFYKTLQDESRNMQNGNFGLWYNKFIPLSNAYKAADERGNDTRAVESYYERYGQMKKGVIAEMLKQKHNDQQAYCESFPSAGYEVVQIEASLESPLLTGIGESHPNEVSMVFDHNMGIPYIPASGIKGIARFAHTFTLIDEACERKPEVEETGRFDDEEEWTLVPLMFGTQKNRGRVIFMDAYPKNVPSLHIDIMNPHYGPYYSDGLPPADHHNPTPIKFLTIAPETIFIFRAVVKKENDLALKVEDALISALTEEGVGAKTAIGYGRFDIANHKESATDKPEEQSSSKSAAPAPPPPVEEVWENAYVSFNAGSGGVVSAKSADKKSAEIRGKEKAQAVVSESLHKKLFDGKKTLPQARVTVRKAGNAWEIVKIEPVG